MKTFRSPRTRFVPAALTMSCIVMLGGSAFGQTFTRVSPGPEPISIEPAPVSPGDGGANSIQPGPTPVSGGGGGIQPLDTVNGTGWKGTTGSPPNWSNAANWDSTGPNTSGTGERNLFFGNGWVTAGRPAGGLTSNNDLTSWTGYRITFENIASPGTFTLQGNAITLADFGGNQAKIENQSTVNQNINFGLTLGGSLTFAELNAVNGALTFGGTVTASGSITDIRLFGSSQTVNFNNTVTLSGRDIGIATSGTGNTVNINGNFTADNFSVMNGGTLKLNSGGTLNSTGIRLGADYVGSGNINNTLGATFALTAATGGQTVAGIINTGTNVSPGSNTSGALLVDSQNTSGTNTISGNIFLDSDLRIQQASGGTLNITNATLDLKNQSLALIGSGGNINITGVIGNSTGSGQLVIGTNGTAATGGTVTLSNTNTYSGQTFVRNGTLAFTAAGSSNNSTLRLGSTSGTNVTANLNLVGAGGGVTISSVINPVTTTGSGNVVTINSLNTSGINTLSGHIGMDRSMTITQTAGGELDITQARSGVTTTTGTDIKGNTLNLGGPTATAGGTINISGDIYNSTGSGTVSVGGSSGATITAILSGNNTYGAGTTLNSGSTLDINSVTALGASTAALNVNGTATIDNTSANAIVLANANGLTVNNNLTFTGTKDLSFGLNATTIGGTASTRTITTTAGTLTLGAISNGATIPTTFAKAGAGTLAVIGNSTYTAATTIAGTLKVDNNGTTTLGNLGGTTGITINATSSGTLLLSGSSGVTDRINNSATIAMNGGKFNTAGLSEGTTLTAGVGALTLQANSFIDLGAGASILHFADSSGATWTASRILEIDNWSGTQSGGGTDQLIFGTTSGGLTAPQIAEIQFLNPDGFSAGTYGAMILANGEVVPVPEPGTWVAGALVFASLLLTQRKRIWRLVKRAQA